MLYNQQVFTISIYKQVFMNKYQCSYLMLGKCQKLNKNYLSKNLLINTPEMNHFNSSSYFQALGDIGSHLNASQVKQFQQNHHKYPAYQKHLNQILEKLKDSQNKTHKLSQYFVWPSTQTSEQPKTLEKYLNQSYKKINPQNKLENLDEQQFQVMQKSVSQSLKMLKDIEPLEYMTEKKYYNLLSNFRRFFLQFSIQYYIATGYTSLPNLTFDSIIYNPKNDTFAIYLDGFVSWQQNDNSKCYLIDLELNLEQLNQFSQFIFKKFTEVTIQSDCTNKNYQEIRQILDYAFENLKLQIAKDTQQILQTYFYRKINSLFYQKDKERQKQNQETKNKKMKPQGPKQKKFHQICSQLKYQRNYHQFLSQVNQQLNYQIICHNFVRHNWQFKRLLLKHTNFSHVNPQNYACFSQCNNTINESQIFHQKATRLYKSQFLKSFKDRSFEMDSKNNEKNQEKSLQFAKIKNLNNLQQDQCDSFEDISSDRQKWENLDEIEEQQTEQKCLKMQKKKSEKKQELQSHYQSILQAKSEISFADLEDDSISDFSLLEQKTQNNDFKVIKKKKSNDADQLSDQQNDFSDILSSKNRRKSCPPKFYHFHGCNTKDKTLKLFQTCLNQPYVLKGFFLQTLDQPIFSKQFKKISDQKDFNLFTLVKNLCCNDRNIKKMELTNKYLIHLMQFQLEFISELSSSQNSSLASVWNCVRFIVLNLFAHLATQIKLKVLSECEKVFLTDNCYKTVFNYMHSHNQRLKNNDDKVRMGLELSYSKILGYERQINDPNIIEKRSNVKKMKQILQRQPELFKLIQELNEKKVTDSYNFQLTQQIYRNILKLMKKQIFTATIIERFYKKVKKNHQIDDIFGQSLFGRNKNIQKAREQFTIFLVEIMKLWNLITFLPFYSFETEKQNVKRVQEKRRLKLDIFTTDQLLKNLDAIYIYQGKRLNQKLMKKKNENLQEIAEYYINLFRKGREFLEASNCDKQKEMRKQKVKEDQELHMGMLCMFGQEKQIYYFMESVKNIFMEKKQEFFLSQKVVAKLLSV